jgi:hypothetical protein
MNQNLIFLPLFLQVLLTFLVGFRLMFVRLREIRRRRIRPQELRTRVDAATRFEESRSAADNFQNLFEFPVLFYVLVIVAYLTGSVSWLLLVLLFFFVAARAAHSAIHVGYNNVMHRFTAFVISMGFLLAGWVVLALRLSF